METSPHINYFAQTDFRGRKTTFGIKSEDRSKHVYVIGKTGMGKSTLLENLAIQDIKNGEGVAFLDPHGKTADLLLDYVPKERIKDVVYFAPFDLENPIAFNIMEDVGPDYRHLVADGLMATFKKIWQDAWSARMEYILSNTLLALLEYPDATLLGVNRMLSDKSYRKKVVDNISDPSVKSFWVDEFAGYTDRFAAEATPAIQNKIGQFTNNPLIRNIIGQPKSSFNLRQLMDDKKILIVNLSKGLIGEQNADLLGGMMVTKIYLAAMSRANVSDVEMHKLPPFYLYVDEFQSFVNESFADILSEARKYKLSLTIAHQYIEQMPENVRSAVFGNVGTLISFRVGPFDAEVLEKVFAPTFTQEDLVNLGFAQIYLSLMIDGVGSRPFSATTLPPIAGLDISNKQKLIENSQKIYGRKRAEVSKYIMDWHEAGRVENKNSAPNNNNSQQRKKEPNSSNFESKKPITQQNTQPSFKKPRPEEIKNTQTDKNTKKESEERPLFSSTGVISLGSLKKKTPSGNNESKTKSTEKGRSALRSALKDLFGSENKESESKAVSAPAPTKDVSASDILPSNLNKSKNKDNKPEINYPDKPKEVPEETLRKILGN